MEKSKVEFVYKNISSLNKISIVNKKNISYFAIYLCAITCYRGDCGFPKRNVAYKRSVA